MVKLHPNGVTAKYTLGHKRHLRQNGYTVTEQPSQKHSEGVVPLHKPWILIQLEFWHSAINEAIRHLILAGVIKHRLVGAAPCPYPGSISTSSDVEPKWLCSARNATSLLRFSRISNMNKGKRPPIFQNASGHHLMTRQNLLRFACNAENSAA